MPSPDSSSPLGQRDALDYAWKMFQYQASQRMQAFNFFLVLMGGLFVGYAGALKEGQHGLAAGISGFAAAVATAFFILDIRNADLVNIARDALKNIETSTSWPNEWQLLNSDRVSRWKTHRVWMRLIQGLLGAAAVVGLVFSGCKCKTANTPQHTGDVRQMPYIKQERRDAILKGERPQDAGELNFAITALVDRYLEDKGEIRYAHLNDVVGAMDCAKMELYRRVAAPYEDKKMAEAGDVYRVLKLKT